MMNQTKTHHFVQEWNKLKAERKSIDYRIARWAHAVRAECSSGVDGDKEFHRWIEAKIGMPAKEREALLDMAHAFRAIPDQATWDAQGAGPTRRVARLPPNERIAVMNEANAARKKFDQVIRERDRVHAARNVNPVQAARAVTPVRAHERGTPVAQGDATVIADWARRLGADALADALSERIADGILAAPLHVVAAAKRRAVVLRRASGRKAA